MASEEQLRALLGGMNAWHTYRNAHPGQARDLSEADLRGSDLSNYCLSGVNLTKALLCNAVLTGADLQTSDLTHADLTGAKLEGANLTEAQLVEAIIDGADLTRARLEGANLHKASLRKARLELTVLRRARFIEANLEDAIFNSATSENAKFRKANLKRIEAKGAQFEEADLTDAYLAEANLEHTDLSKTRGLVQSQLAGTNLYHAVLDDNIADFQELDRIAEIAKYTRKLFSVLLLLCVFSWFVIAQATDEALVTNSAATVLPLVQASVPLASLFYSLPALLIVFFVYFHINLQGLWRGLANLPAIFPDGGVLPLRAYPWIMTNLTYWYVPRLKDWRPTYWIWAVAITILGAWFITPLTLFWFFARYAIVGDSIGAYWLIICLSTITWFATDSYMMTRKVFRDAGRLSAASGGMRCPVMGVSRLITCVAVVGMAALLGVSFHRQLPYLCHVDANSFGATKANFWDTSRFRVDLRYAELSKRKPGFEKESGDNLFNVRPAQLSKRIFQYGDLQGAYLVGADLTYADLTKASLRGADLRKADISHAILRQADLSEANLAGAIMRDADLRGARLENSSGLTAEQVMEACGDANTKLPASLTAAQVKIKSRD